MDKYLLLKARQEKRTIYGPFSWWSRTWQVWSDGAYTVRVDFGLESNAEKSGVMRKDRFDALREALEQDWAADENSVLILDGDDWSFDCFAPDGSLLRSNRLLEYICGWEKLERIADRLPGKTFLRENQRR